MKGKAFCSSLEGGQQSEALHFFFLMGEWGEGKAFYASLRVGCGAKGRKPR
ncbi:hypothetical protein X927_03185 [Petrotoga mexicana DSM 14811]|uniref:Uncharacterized protein n=1 Tax=Petrotoga mexicana DSM 14811 TaxID=1122954 RepID=A0A2K1PCG0_9BACT|nr:hypothetical protein X927_03185 [Petrotoga mexicana DSM 14811]